MNQPLVNKRPGYDEKSETWIERAVKSGLEMPSTKAEREAKMEFYSEPAIQVDSEENPLSETELREAWDRYRAFVRTIEHLRQLPPEKEDIRQVDKTSKADSLQHLKEVIASRIRFCEYRGKLEDKLARKKKLQRHGPAMRGEVIDPYLAGTVRKLNTGKELKGIGKLKNPIPKQFAPTEQEKKPFYFDCNPGNSRPCERLGEVMEEELARVKASTKMTRQELLLDNARILELQAMSLEV